jgi:hypothetical protein
MKRLIISKYLLSAAFAAAAFASAGTASAQSLSHYGSPLPRYYDAQGAQHWGSWAPPATAQAAQPSRPLYLYVKPRASRAQAH